MMVHPINREARIHHNPQLTGRPGPDIPAHRVVRLR
jgi:hypothetical protein